MTMSANSSSVPNMVSMSIHTGGGGAGSGATGGGVGGGGGSGRVGVARSKSGYRYVMIHAWFVCTNVMIHAECAILLLATGHFPIL